MASRQRINTGDWPLGPRPAAPLPLWTQAAAPAGPPPAAVPTAALPALDRRIPAALSRLESAIHEVLRELTDKLAYTDKQAYGASLERAFFPVAGCSAVPEGTVLRALFRGAWVIHKDRTLHEESILVAALKKLSLHYDTLRVKGVKAFLEECAMAICKTRAALTPSEDKLFGKATHCRRRLYGAAGALCDVFASLTSEFSVALRDTTGAQQQRSARTYLALLEQPFDPDKFYDRDQRYDFYSNIRQACLPGERPAERTPSALRALRQRIIAALACDIDENLPPRERAT